MQRDPGGLKRKSFPFDAQSYGPCHSDGSQPASYESQASKRTRSYSASGPEEIFSSGSSGPAPTVDCQSAPLLSNVSAAGWEASSLSQHQQGLHQPQLQPLLAAWSQPQQHQTAPQFSGFSPLCPPHLRQQQQQQQLQQQIQSPQPASLLQAQQSSSVVWPVQPQQQAPPTHVAMPPGGSAAEESMEEDTPSLRQSNSAPDLHVMVQQPLQSMPRMLLGPRQQPLGSSSAVGALVPYTATSTKAFLEEQYWRVQRQQLLDALQQARSERAAAATIIEEIGEPGPAVDGGAWSGVVPAASVPLAAVTNGTEFGDHAVPVTGSRKRKLDGDAAEADTALLNKRMHLAPHTSGDAMDIA